MWYFVVGVSEGKPWRAGPAKTYDEAFSIGIEACGSNFNIYESPTPNFNDARQNIRFQQVRAGVPIADTLKRHRIHKIDRNEASQAHRSTDNREIDGE